MSPLERYGLSKAGNWLHGVECAKRYADDGVLSFPINPGHLRSDLYREGGTLLKFALRPVLFPPTYGAYVELFAALSPSLTTKDSGAWSKYLRDLGTLQIADILCSLTQLFHGVGCIPSVAI